jgi:hypothetical protein
LERTDELEEQVERLTGEVEEMRARMARLESGEPGRQNGVEPKSRRGFLKFGAGAVMGALGMAATKVLPAAAATGGPVQLGNSPAANVADAPTTIQTTSITNAQVFGALANGFTPGNLALAGTFTGPLQGLGTTSGIIEGVDGWAEGPQGFGVYGLTNSGTGVVGEAITGIGLHARRSGRIRQDPRPAGAPTYPPNQFEQVRDSNGVLWINGTAGTGPAVWRRVNSLRFDKADGSGGAFVPVRLVDTRNAGPNQGPMAGGSTTSIQVAYIPASGSTPASGVPTIPPDAIGIVGNLTAVNYTNVGYLTIFPAGTTNPGTSSVNFLSGQSAVANAFTVGLGTGVGTTGMVSIYVGSPSPGVSHFIVDITGYIQ